MPPIDPQQIPYQPTQPPPPQPFQGGPYAQVAATKIAHTPTSLDWMKGVGDVGNQALQNYLEGQRLQQQAPLTQAQTGLAQAQTAGEQQKLYGGQLVNPSTGQPQDQGYTLSGTAPSAPMPGGMSMGMPPASGTTIPQGNQPPSGTGQQFPMTIGQPGGVPQPSPMMTMAPPQGQQDLFAHMHPDPNNPFSLPGNPQQQPNQASVPRSALYGLQETQANRKAYGSIFKNSPLVKKYLGDLSGMQDEDVGRLGDPEKILGSLASIESTANYRNASLGIQGQRLGVEQTKNTQDTITQLQNQQTQLVKDLSPGIVSSFLQKTIAPSDKNYATYQQWSKLQDRIDKLQGGGTLGGIGGGKIQVRRKSDGQVGTISEQYFDPQKYEKVGSTNG